MRKTRSLSRRSMRTARASLSGRSTVLRDSRVRFAIYNLMKLSLTLVWAPLALKWFDAEGNEAEEYKGGRELDDLTKLCVSFPPVLNEWEHLYGHPLLSSITEKSGVKSNIRPPPPPAYKILDTHTFGDVALVCPTPFMPARSSVVTTLAYAEPAK